MTIIDEISSTSSFSPFALPHTFCLSVSSPFALFVWIFSFTPPLHPFALFHDLYFLFPLWFTPLCLPLFLPLSF